MTDLPFDIVELAPCPVPAAGAPLREIAGRRDAWTPDEVDALRAAFAADEDLAAIAADLGRPLHGLRTKVLDLGLRRNSSRPWGELEEDELRRRYGVDATAAIAADLGRTAAAVYARAGLLGLTEGTAPPWTAWEDAQLRAGYGQGVPVAQLAVLIGRPASGVLTRASNHGLSHANHPPDWTAAELARALELAESGILYRAIRARMVEEGFPARSKQGLASTLRKAGYGRGWGRPWTAEEDALLRHLYAHGLPVRPAMTRLGRTPSAIRYRVGEIGLQGTHPKPDGFRAGPVWTEEDTSFLREHYGRMKPADIAARLGRALGGVYMRANALGLKAHYHRDWTEQERQAIRVAYDRGLTLGDLQDATGRDVAVIARQAIRMGLRFSGRPMKVERGPRRGRRTWTVPEILALEAA